MTVGVVVFPGSNCDHDTYHVVKHVCSQQARFIWHKDPDLAGLDAIVLPGGFSYGDYLRTGAIARFSPVMRAVSAFAEKGGPVLGICNGFQILCEAGLLEGALLRNASPSSRPEACGFRSTTGARSSATRSARPRSRRSPTCSWWGTRKRPQAGSRSAIARRETWEPGASPSSGPGSPTWRPSGPPKKNPFQEVPHRPEDGPHQRPHPRQGSARHRRRRVPAGDHATGSGADDRRGEGPRPGVDRGHRHPAGLPDHELGQVLLPAGQARVGGPQAPASHRGEVSEVPGQDRRARLPVGNIALDKIVYEYALAGFSRYLRMYENPEFNGIIEIVFAGVSKNGFTGSAAGYTVKRVYGDAWYSGNDFPGIQTFDPAAGAEIVPGDALSWQDSTMIVIIREIDGRILWKAHYKHRGAFELSSLYVTTSDESARLSLDRIVRQFEKDFIFIPKPENKLQSKKPPVALIVDTHKDSKPE